MPNPCLSSRLVWLLHWLLVVLGAWSRSLGPCAGPCAARRGRRRAGRVPRAVCRRRPGARTVPGVPGTAAPRPAVRDVCQLTPGTPSSQQQSRGDWHAAHCRAWKLTLLSTGMFSRSFHLVSSRQLMWSCNMLQQLEICAPPDQSCRNFSKAAVPVRS